MTDFYEAKLKEARKTLQIKLAQRAKLGKECEKLVLEIQSYERHLSNNSRGETPTI